MSALPDAGAVATLLGELLGREVRLARAIAPGEPPATVAVYAASDGRIVGLWGFDLPSAAAAAGAHSRVPPAVAQDAVKARRLPELLEENLHEVMNVGARLFSTGARRAGLAEVHRGAEAAETLRGVRAAAALRADFELRIAGYAPGRMFLSLFEEAAR